MKKQQESQHRYVAPREATRRHYREAIGVYVRSTFSISIGTPFGSNTELFAQMLDRCHLCSRKAVYYYLGEDTFFNRTEVFSLCPDHAEEVKQLHHRMYGLMEQYMMGLPMSKVTI